MRFMPVELPADAGGYAPGDGVNEVRTRALVTGGTGTLGRALVSRLEERGWSVLAAGRRDGDLADATAARALVARAAAELGGLDLVVNAAGEGFAVRPLAEVEEADWDRAFGATAKGTFFVSQAAAPHLRESRGLLVMIEDVAATLPWANLAPHAAAKAAQAHLTRIFARALAPEVRVCGIAPGPVAVPGEHAEGRAKRTLLERVGTADDVAGALLYLLDAPFVTGTTVVVDGGRSLKTLRGDEL
jgi:pteridine reductase